MDARFELKLEQSDKMDLRERAHQLGMSEAALVRFGMKWMRRHLDVLAGGDDKKLERDLRSMLDEMRADPKLAPTVPALESAASALDAEGDGNKNAAALYDMICLVCGEPLPIREKLSLLSDLLDFEGRVTFRVRAPVEAKPEHERR